MIIIHNAQTGESSRSGQLSGVVLSLCKKSSLNWMHVCMSVTQPMCPVPSD
jgi:hypothetical protein